MSIRDTFNRMFRHNYLWDACLEEAEGNPYVAERIYGAVKSRGVSPWKPLSQQPSEVNRYEGTSDCG